MLVSAEELEKDKNQDRKGPAIKAGKGNWGMPDSAGILADFGLYPKDRGSCIISESQ